MCGIAGFLTATRPAAGQMGKATLHAMSERIVHRGPDDMGLWRSPDQNAGLTFRRLAIQDLTTAGAQPMTSQDSRFVMVFNGEIYNHPVLRTALEADIGPITWRGHSDTETLLAGICRWGLADTLKRAYGMFALALWDTQANTLALARDRMGEKPLYLARVNTGWAFASELQAFRALDDFAAAQTLNDSAIADQLATGVIPDTACVLTHVQKIQPGTILTLTPDDQVPQETVYEDFQMLMAEGKSNVATYQSETADAAADRVEAVLKDVISSQMISDVPLGSFLSGGVDSSLITALMQGNLAKPVKTFSIGFEDLGYDESRHAEAVADHLGTDHQTFRLREDDALDLIPQLASVYGEPFADSSQIATLLLCREARKHVTVALTGDGGDEVFGGYNRHVLAPRLWSRISRLPRFVRGRGAFVGHKLQQLASQGSVGRTLTNKLGISASVINKAARFGEIAANSASLDDVYAGLTRQCDETGQFLRSRAAPSFSANWLGATDLAPAERMMALDSTGYLPSDILVKVDRASMNASLETRAPFIDARVIKAAWSLDLPHRIRGQKGKAILRDILYRHVPRDMIERPKQGFAVPIDAWLRGPLRQWAAGLLDPDRLAISGILDPVSVQNLWAAHLSGTRNQGQLLWSILMLQQWLNAWQTNIKENNPQPDE